MHPLILNLFCNPTNVSLNSPIVFCKPYYKTNNPLMHPITPNVACKPL